MPIQHMVCPSKIAKTAKNKVSMDNGNLVFGTHCYEAGMVEVLKGIAMKELDEGDVCIETSKQVTKLNKKATEAYQALVNAVSNREVSLVKEMDEVYNLVAAAEAEDHFIEGFLRGYRYLKHIMEFHTVVEEDC